MSKVSTVILTDTSGVLNVTGVKFKADGWFGFTDGLHTVAWYLSGPFLGDIIIEATLVTDPLVTDWFTVDVAGDDLGFIRFDSASTDNSDTKSFNFTGNYVWIRARIDRAAFNTAGAPGSPLTTGNSGSVSKVLFNH